MTNRQQHLEGTWPITQQMMAAVFKGIPDAEIAAMLGGNAAAFYGFDAAALMPLAARIGPEKRLFQ